MLIISIYIIALFFCNICDSFIVIFKENHVKLKPLEMTIAIVGTGPAGLATAIMLARRGMNNITLFDQFAQPPKPDDKSVWGNFDMDRSYLIGLSGRGQIVLKDLDVLEKIKTYSTSLEGAIVWDPDTPVNEPKERDFSTRTYTTVCIERDRISSCLLQEVQEKYNSSIKVSYYLYNSVST